MDRVTRFKEAFKTALALVLAYYIALKLDWMNPYWAGWAVAMISLPTSGQSIRKGILRLAGTVPGCAMALAMLGMAPQSRWGFMFLACAWIFFTAYMMLADKNRSYFWQVAGFVCLVITVAGPASSQNAFQHAVFRTVETAMGILVYTLVSVFLWPRTNAGAIKKSSGALVAVQAEIFRAAWGAITGRGASEKLGKLHTKEVQHLGDLAQALQTESCESYEVHETRHLWERFYGLSTALMEALDRWQTGFAEFKRIDVNAIFPDADAFFTGIDARFEQIQRALNGSPSGHGHLPVSLSVDPDAFRGLPHFDRAAVAVARKELETLEALTVFMLECAWDLRGEAPGVRTPEPLSPHGDSRRGFRLPVLDMDYLKRAAFAASTTGAGFLIWIFVNPPGHASWFNLSGSMALAVAGMPQMRTTLLIKPVGLASALGLGVYVFVMPQLSTFLGLGLLIFLCMFITCFFFSGLGRLAGIVGILNEISIQNQQSYNFAAMANGYIFMLMVFAFIFAMSYMLRSSRPEKALLHLLGRFFRSAGFLISQMASDPSRPPGLIGRWKTALCRHELSTLPAKIGAWGKAIDHRLFPGNTPEQVQALLASLQAIVYRTEALLDAGGARQAKFTARKVGGDIRAWHTAIETTFKKWSRNPEVGPVADLQEQLAVALIRLEERIDAALEASDQEAISDADGENFYRLLGGFRGVSEAAVAYAEVAGTIDWTQWREEVFS